MTPRLLVLLSAVVLAGCPRPKPAGPAGPLTEQQVLTARAAKVARDVEAVLREQDQRVWVAWTEGKPANLEQTYAGHPGLFSPGAIRELERLRQLTTDPREVRALTHLQTHLVGEHLSAQLGELNEAIANVEAAAKFQVGDKEHAYRDLDRLLANEPGTTARRALWSGATAVVSRLNPLIRQREEKVHQLVQALGYPSYEAFAAELRQVDLDRLGYLAEEILQVTEPAYRTVMEELARRELSLPLASVRRADLPRVFRARGVDLHFPQDALLPRVRQTVAGLGISLEALPNLKLDAAARPGKNPRPLAVAPVVPDDVRLSVLPSPGVRMQAAVLHEVGHALHFAFTRERRFELAKLGGGASAEALSLLFGDLVEDPVWLQEQVGLSGQRLDAYLAATSAYKLFLVREAAGRMLYQLQLHRREGEGAREVYRELMARAYGFSLTAEDAERFLVEMEDFFLSADDFRGWFLAAQIQGQLKARFGPRWWTSKEAGDFLRGLWAPGNAQNARELALAMGEDAVKPDVLLLRLATTLKVPIRLNAQFAREVDPAPAGLSAPDAAPEEAPATDAGTP